MNLPTLVTYAQYRAVMYTAQAVLGGGQNGATRGIDG